MIASVGKAGLGRARLGRGAVAPRSAARASPACGTAFMSCPAGRGRVRGAMAGRRGGSGYHGRPAAGYVGNKAGGGGGASYVNPAGYGVVIRPNAAGGNGSISISSDEIPEPASMALLRTGLARIGLTRRRARRRAG